MDRCRVGDRVSRPSSASKHQRLPNPMWLLGSPRTGHPRVSGIRAAMTATPSTTIPQIHTSLLGILVWSPLAGGLLSGKYRRQGTDAPEGSRHLSGDWDEPPIHDQDKLYDTIESLVEIGSERGVSAAQIALAYLIAKPAVTSVIVGSANRGAAHGQPGLGRARAHRRGGVTTGRGQRRATALPLLASGREHTRSAQPGRSQPAWALHRLTAAYNHRADNRQLGFAADLSRSYVGLDGTTPC